MDKMSVEQLLDELLTSSNLSIKLQDIRYYINTLKSGRQISMKSDVTSLQYDQEMCERELGKYNDFKSNLEKYRAEYHKLSKMYCIVELAWTKYSNCDTLSQTKDLQIIYNEMVKLHDQRSKCADSIQSLIINNLGIVFKLESRTVGFREKTLQDVLKQAGYQTGMSISSDLQKQTDDMLKQNIGSMGIDIEKLQKADEITKIISDRQKNKFNDEEVIDVQMIYPLEVGNVKSEKIFSDVYQRLERIQYLHKEHKLSINEEQYNNIVAALMRIIELYQDIQLIIATQEAFKNTSVNEYDNGINKVVEHSHKEIEKTYNKLNKYVAHIDRDNILGPVIDGIGEVVETVKDVKDGVINSVDSPSKNVQDPKLIDKNDEIATLDNFRQQIFAIEQNKELMQRKRLLEIEYIKFRDLKAGQANIPFVEFLKIYYPDEIELIKSEEVREQQIQYVYDLWQKSGRHMEFGKYAEEIQGIKIKYPYDYTKEEDTINYESTDQSGISYVETKKNNIEAARERYRKKSALWKAMNKKMNPDYMNFDSMTNEQIEELYGGKRR